MYICWSQSRQSYENSAALGNIFNFAENFYMMILCHRTFIGWSVHPSVLAWPSLWVQYLTTRLWELHHIYNWGTVGDRDKLLDFELQRSKVKVTAWWPGGILPPVSVMHSFTLPGPDVMMTFWRSWVQRSQTTFPVEAYSWMVCIEASLVVVENNIRSVLF